MSALVVLSTAPKKAEADKIARTLLREHLVACVNLVPGVQSRYWWKGKIQSDAEVLLIMKTTKGRFAALKRRLHELHSYTVPEVLALPVAAGGEAYLRWLSDAMRPGRLSR
jgi:periplasmic divalent cation tolerance protein